MSSGRPPGRPPGPQGEGPTPAEVEALLAAWRVPPARAAFRERVGNAFLAEGSRGTGADSPSHASNEPRTEPRDDPASAMRLEELLSRTAASPARPEFRAALREAFCSGAIERSAPPEPRSAARRRVPLRPLLLVTAAAAALLLFLHLRNEEPVWRVLGVEGEGAPVLDGFAFDSEDAAGLERGLAEAREVASGETTLDLVYRGIARLHVRPGTTWRAVRDPGPEALALEIDQGEIYVRTLAALDGRPITIRTPDGVVRITGTALGVLTDESGTCVCVARGHVRVTCHEGQPGCERELDGHESVQFVRAESAHFGTPVPFPEPADQHVGDLLAFVEG